MKILLLGKGGQIASEFEDLKIKDKNWTFLCREDLDITSKESILSYFRLEPYELVINCTGFTSVDQAEDMEEQAYSINEEGVKNLIEACKKFNCKLIHYSTDYVFDGESKFPYKETDLTAPLNVYGMSKLAGENILINSSVKSLIIRSSWVYSYFCNNFVKTILKLGEEKFVIDVVNDQVGSPTFARDLVKVSLLIINNTNYEWINGGEIIHYSNEGICSWHQFASKIVQLKNLDIEIKPKTSEEFSAKAERPKYSVLDKSKIKSKFKIHIPYWEESLSEMLKQL